MYSFESFKYVFAAPNHQARDLPKMRMTEMKRMTNFKMRMTEMKRMTNLKMVNMKLGPVNITELKQKHYNIWIPHKGTTNTRRTSGQ